MTASVAIIGGNLQGVEAAYLAKKAGWEVLLIDKNPRAAASLMCDRFLPLIITADVDPNDIFKRVELIIPAIENDDVLGILREWSSQTQIPLAFDMEAYVISSSKKKSGRIFEEVNIGVPKAWPECGFPVIHNEQEPACEFSTRNALGGMVAQEYLEGPSYSIEVIGLPGNYTPLQVTKLHMDSDFDCKRVLAPSGLDSTLVTKLEQTAIRVAERIGLKGLMDLEAIWKSTPVFPARLPLLCFNLRGSIW